MDVSKYKPGRRLDAMVAMAMGWKWVKLERSAYGKPSRWLDVPAPYSRAVVPANQSDPLRKIHDHWSTAWWGSGQAMTSQFSHLNGIAFEAALEAGVLDHFALATGQGLIHQYGFGVLVNSENHDDIEAPTHAHVLCLGILAIQPDEKLAEYESWLEGVG